GHGAGHNRVVFAVVGERTRLAEGARIHLAGREIAGIEPVTGNGVSGGTLVRPRDALADVDRHAARLEAVVHDRHRRVGGARWAGAEEGGRQGASDEGEPPPHDLSYAMAGDTDGASSDVAACSRTARRSARVPRM